MSSATAVPETYELDSEDARRVLASARLRCVLRDAIVRLRAGDGFTSARALAFQLVLATIPGVIVAVAIAVHGGGGPVPDFIRQTIDSLAPGPAGDMFRDAFEQGDRAGHSTNLVPIIGGSLALLVAATTGFGQVERAINRLYGVEADRPSRQKYGRAFVLALTAGVLIGAAVIALAAGRGAEGAFDDGAPRMAWLIARWPLSAVVLVAAITLIFRHCPNRHQPGLSWLAVGGAISVVGVLVVAGALHLYLNASDSFGDTYGPLAGFMGLLLWAYGSSVALLVGLAFAAQLEAVRAGVAAPRDPEKAIDLSRAPSAQARAESDARSAEEQAGEEPTQVLVEH